MTEVSVRDLRNHTADVVRRIEAGERLTLTVNKRPVADIVAHDRRSPWIPREEVERIRRDAPADPQLLTDVRGAFPQTVDELWPQG